MVVGASEDTVESDVIKEVTNGVDESVRVDKMKMQDYVS